MKLVQIVGLSLILAVAGAGGASADSNHTANAKSKASAMAANSALTFSFVGTQADKTGSEANSFGVALADGNAAIGVSNAIAGGTKTSTKTSTKTKAVGGPSGWAASGSRGSASASD